MGIFDFFKKNKNIINDNGLNKIYTKNGKGNLILEYYKKDGLLDGKFIIFFINNRRPKVEGNFKNNLLDGYWSYWGIANELEQPCSIEIWKNGILESIEIIYRTRETQLKPLIKSKHIKLNGIGQVDIEKYPVYRKTAVLFELRNVGLKEENITIKD